MFRKMVLAWIVCLLALTATIVVVPMAQGAGFRTIVVAYEHAGYNNPCLVPGNMGGCKSYNLQWDLGGCSNSGSPGYRWTAHNRGTAEHYSVYTQKTMSSIQLMPGTGCNALYVQAGNGQQWGTCLTRASMGIKWFGPGYNDDTYAVMAYFLPQCGAHL